jgi:hypothetical protein
MHKFPFEEINLETTRKDCFSALFVWIVIAGFSFILLPGFGLIEAKNKQSAWFFASLPPGVIGSILVGTCSELIRLCQEHYQGRSKRLLIWLGTLGGWLGLAGVIFPLIIIGLDLWR